MDRSCSHDRSQVRVKRCGKSAPACEATRTARQTPPGARSSRGMGCPPVRGDTDNPRVGRIDGWSPVTKVSTESRLQADSPSQLPLTRGFVVEPRSFRALGPREVREPSISLRTRPIGAEYSVVWVDQGKPAGIVGPDVSCFVRFIASLARLAVRSGRSKDLEIIVLRHQLIVLRREIERPALNDDDRTRREPGAHQ
jgi:hypothetical protein